MLPVHSATLSTPFCLFSTGTVQLSWTFLAVCRWSSETFGHQGKQWEKRRKRETRMLNNKNRPPHPRHRSLHLPLPEVKRTTCFQTFIHGYPQSRKRSNDENYIYHPTHLISPIMVGKRHSCDAILKINCKCAALRSRPDCHHCHFSALHPLPADCFYSVSKLIPAMEPTVPPPPPPPHSLQTATTWSSRQGWRASGQGSGVTGINLTDIKGWVVVSD